ncbi:hypothetical protein BV898_09858 [Hypsibius exemplaris]|uniref:Uncharacterized protein n=1 Tax=Hypsibius exemplaris TaxID=2072580 RepID=A0A1W0WL37_HYPEX|nr:hypothetical protein BV898_09858 [Hypsibius exemplaris]
MDAEEASLEEHGQEEELEDGLQGESPRKRSRKKFHFSIELDNQLIKAASEENPYIHTGKDTFTAWENVAKRMDEIAGTTDLLPRTCRDRLERLLAYLDQDSPLLKGPTEFEAESQERIQLLQDMRNLRKESAKKTGQPITPLRVKPRPLLKGASEEKAVARRSQRITAYNIPTRIAPDGSGGQQLQGISTSSGTTILYTYAATPVDAGSVDATTTLAFDAHGNSIPASVDSVQHEHSNHGDRQLLINGGTPQERSIVAELLECRRLELESRNKELEVRGQEAAVQRMKLEQKTKQWEAEQKERALLEKERKERLALETEERKLVLALMKKHMFPNGDAAH